MPKKTTRSGAQRNRPKVQKNVSLVRPNAGVVTEETGPQLEAEPVEVEETQLEVEGVESDVEGGSGGVRTATATATATTTTPARSRARAGRASKMVAPPATEAEESEATTAQKVETAPKGSASARLAARRQNQKSQQRIAPTLITPEHYSYVRKDLIYIAVLAVLMFATIIILHLIPGIGF